MIRTAAFLGLAAVSLLAGASARVTCADCPVLSVNPRASRPLGRVANSIPCRLQVRDGLPLPDPKCTPGAVNPTVTLAVLRDRSFRTGCVRNCLTSQRDRSATYRRYGIQHPRGNSGQNQICELDHLVPLEMCGPAGGPLRERYFKQKDVVENYLTARVKAGNMDLAEAQKDIARDWTRFLTIAKGWCATRRCRGAERAWNRPPVAPGSPTLRRVAPTSGKWLHRRHWRAHGPNVANGAALRGRRRSIGSGPPNSGWRLKGAITRNGNRLQHCCDEFLPPKLGITYHVEDLAELLG